MVDDLIARRLRSVADSAATGAVPMPFTVDDVIAIGESRRARVSRRRRRAGALALAAAVLAAIVVPLPTFHLVGRHGRPPATAGSGHEKAGHWKVLTYVGQPYDFKSPGEVILDGSVALVGSKGAITEISASTGAVSWRIDRPASALRWSGTFAVAREHILVPSGTDTLAEFSERTGAFLGQVRHAYHFDGPTDGLFDGSHVWFANQASDTLTEVDPVSGALVRVLSAPRYRFDDPADMALSGHDLWVADAGLPGATEIDVRTGALVSTVYARRYGFDACFSDASIDGRVWFANYYEGNSLTEVLASSGGLVRVLHAAGTAIDIPFHMAAGDGSLWVTVDDGLAELNPISGTVEHVFSAPRRAFSALYGVAAGAGHVWVTNSGGDSVAELTWVPRGR